MNSRVTIDKAGRIVLPKPVRDELQLVAGDALELDSTGEEIMLRPSRSSAPLRKKQGVWVFRSGEKLAMADVERVRRELRTERETQVLGKHKRRK